MATCPKCGKQHSSWRDAAHTRPASYCGACNAENMRKYRPRHSELPEEERRRANARSYTNVAIRRGRLARQPCQECGASPAEAHHSDYSKPLLVTWLCRACHRAHHAESA